MTLLLLEILFFLYFNYGAHSKLTHRTGVTAQTVCLTGYTLPEPKGGLN